jgi:hypothetical protein
LEKLSLTGGGHLNHLKEDLVPFVLSLMANESLTHLDISRNEAGDNLAVALSKVLQTNNTLRRIDWDRNGITLVGFRAINYGLARNSCLTSMSHPNWDLTGCIKAERAAVMEVLSDIEQVLLRS